MSSRALISGFGGQLVKSFRKLHRSKGRRDQGLFLVEGVKLVREALDAGYPVDTVVVTPLFQERNQDLAARLTASARRHEVVSPDVLRRMASLDSVADEGVLASLPMRDLRALAGSVEDGNSDPAGAGGDGGGDFEVEVALESVGDPGNVGTLLRTGAAAGLSRLFLTGQSSVQPHSPKMLRASAGYWFRVPINQEPDTFALLRRASRRCQQGLACVPLRVDCEHPPVVHDHESVCFWDVDFSRPSLVLLGKAAFHC